MYKVNKYINIILLFTIIFFFTLISKAHADPPPNISYPSTLPPLSLPTLSYIRLSYIDHGIDDIFRSPVFALSAQFGLGEKKSHWEFGLNWQHLIGHTPSFFAKKPESVSTGQTNDAGISAGYCFGLKNIEIAPFVRIHDIFTLGMGWTSENLINAQIGARIAFHIYPDTTVISLKYGHSFPLFHMAEEKDSANLFAIGLNAISLEMSYKFLPNCEAFVGYQFWQLPADMGQKKFSSTDTVALSGFMLGAGYLF